MATKRAAKPEPEVSEPEVWSAPKEWADLFLWVTPMDLEVHDETEVITRIAERNGIPPETVRETIARYQESGGTK